MSKSETFHMFPRHVSTYPKQHQTQNLRVCNSRLDRASSNRELSSYPVSSVLVQPSQLDSWCPRSRHPVPHLLFLSSRHTVRSTLGSHNQPRTQNQYPFSPPSGSRQPCSFFNLKVKISDFRWRIIWSVKHQVEYWRRGRISKYIFVFAMRSHFETSFLQARSWNATPTHPDPGLKSHWYRIVTCSLP